MLKTRLITALILVPIFLIALFYLTGLEWQLLILAGVVIAAWEWASLSKFNKVFKVLYPSIILVVGLILMFVYPNLIGVFTLISILLSSVFWIFLAPIWLFTQVKIKNPILLGMLGLTIILPLWFSMVSLRQVGPLLLLTIMMTVWIADSAAYFAGKRFGRHKLAASISPGKTWEGVWGACIAVALYAIAICYFFETEYWLLLLMLAVTVASVMGDLVESLFKRQAEVKDSGAIFPGHGGILDRIDGLTSSLPLVTFLLLLPVYYNHWFA